ncbi:MAG: hypothetical protein A2297_00100 [Elusimicrobia bacterium RIFOXYB2_FULL_48_7]|nr:MAG: hypothetical protein A2297_00100 [Elusimicrobia bacterium RIFOXYB2_FULL_48_7]
MGNLGAFAASFNYMNNGIFEGRDSAGNLTGSYTAGDLGGSIGWGREFFTDISLGAAIKYNQQTLAGTAYSATAMDLGVLWSATSRLNLGLTYSNLGTKVANSTLDSGMRLGASYELEKGLLLAISSELKAEGGFESAQVGVESYVHPRLAIRGGYVLNFTDSQLEGLTGVTAGIGVQIVKNLTFDYGYLPYGELGVSQRVSLTYKFGCPEEAKPAPVAEVKPEPVPAPKPPEPIVVETKVIILEKEKIVILEDGHFEFDSVALTKTGVKAVTENIQILKDNPEAKIRVAGYTSASGTDEYNQKLSERRATAVKEILIKEGGIAAERIATIGYGEKRPAEFEATPAILHTEAARANKRVLFEIIVK